MKTTTGIVVLAVAIFFAFILQEMLPQLRVFHGARVLLAPMLLCYGALALPFWGMLLLAFWTGFLSDLWYMHIVGGQVEIGLGWSILYFVLFGMLAHGFEPIFRRGAWWLHPIASAVCTSVYLALQFVILSFQRGSFEFGELVLWWIFAPGLMAALLAPLVHLIAWQGAQFFPHDSRRLHGY